MPCCVFSRLFAFRRVGCAPVRTHEDLCRYLLAKHPAARRETLPFAGKNTVIYVTHYGE